MSRKMRWDCNKQGCWKDRHQADLTLYDDCLPGKIGMTDIDGMVEVNARFLLVEWKHGRDVPRGQSLMFERLTALGPDFTVFTVDGNPATGETRGWQLWFEGRPLGWRDGDLDGFRDQVRAWAEWAQSDRGME